MRAIALYLATAAAGRVRSRPAHGSLSRSDCESSCWGIEVAIQTPISHDPSMRQPAHIGKQCIFPFEFPVFINDLLSIAGSGLEYRSPRDMAQILSREGVS